MANHKDQPAENTSIEYFIDRIALVQQTPSNFSHVSFESKEELNFLLDVYVNIFCDKSIVQVIINYKFCERTNHIIEVTIENDFKILNISDLINEDKILDPTFLEFLLALSINHSRGILYMTTKGSKLETYYFPTITRDQIVEKLKLNTPKIFNSK